MSRILHIVSNVSPPFTLSFLGNILGFDDFDNPGESWSVTLQNDVKGFSHGWTVAEGHTSHQNKAAHYQQDSHCPCEPWALAESVVGFPHSPFPTALFEGRQHVQHVGETLSLLEHSVST